MTKRLLVMLCMLITVSGCDAAWLPETVIKVDPAAISEVRSIGRVVARTTADPFYERTVQVIEILVFDFDAPDYSQALSEARGLLRKRGWSEIFTDEYGAVMESDRWRGTTARLGKLEEVASLGATLEPQVAEMLHADPAKSDSYVVISLSSVEE
ncbi:hypothetical protein ACWEPC_43870 [Nonomuraea sp. NPDC004297]